jgi:hypothetical protein
MLQKSEAVSELSKLTLSAMGHCRLEAYTAEVAVTAWEHLTFLLSQLL